MKLYQLDLGVHKQYIGTTDLSWEYANFLQKIYVNKNVQDQVHEKDNCPMIYFFQQQVEV